MCGMLSPCIQCIHPQDKESTRIPSVSQRASPHHHGIHHSFKFAIHIGNSEEILWSWMSRLTSGSVTSSFAIRLVSFSLLQVWGLWVAIFVVFPPFQQEFPSDEIHWNLKSGEASRKSFENLYGGISGGKEEGWGEGARLLKVPDEIYIWFYQ